MYIQEIPRADSCKVCQLADGMAEDAEFEGPQGGEIGVGAAEFGLIVHGQHA